jgi:hypothetical protein
MRYFICSCIFFICQSFLSKPESAKHPVFVTITEIEQNVKEKSVEISCKIFTDDFEKALRAVYKTKVDLLDDKTKPAMDKLVNDYVQKHLKISLDGKLYTLKYVGYEKIEEAIYSYFEIENIAIIKKISITDDLLYEYKKEQMSLLHVSVAGKRQSTKMTNPEKTANLVF